MAKPYLAKKIFYNPELWLGIFYKLLLWKISKIRVTQAFGNTFGVF